MRLRKDLFVDKSIFMGGLVIQLTAANLGKSQVAIEASGSRIGFAHLEENSLRTPVASDFKQLPEEEGTQTATAAGIRNDYILDFPFGSEVPSDYKPAHGVIHKRQSDTPGTISEEPLILTFAPMRSARRIAIEGLERRNVGRSGLADLHSAI
jgi:hypothetical protein